MCGNNRNYLVLPIVLLLGIVVFSSHLFAAEETIITKQKTYIFHTALQTPIKEILTARIQEAFQRLSLNAKIAINPSSQRAMMLANEDGDGDAARVPNIKEIAPKNTTNLVQVPESILVMKLVVYTKTLSFPVDGWSSLENCHNGARIGAKILENNIPGKRTFLPTTIQLLKMLGSDRIDTLVEWSLIADNAINNLKMTTIKKLSPPVKLQPFYIYLHKKHQLLVPRLAKVLIQMKEDGSFERIEKDVLKKLTELQ